MQLSPFLYDIADAIRGKEGSTALIPAADFASRIANLPSGVDEIDKLAQGTLTDFVNDRITEIKPYLFSPGSDSYNRSLRNVRCANATKVGECAFQKCDYLMSVHLPKVEVVGSGSFAGAGTAGVNYMFPSCKRILDSAFEKSSFSNLYMYGASENDTGLIGGYAFYNAILESLVIQSQEGVVYASFYNTFANTPIEQGTGYIYVPRSLVDAYKNSEGWSTYANQIRALEDYTVDGTTTGELDPNKI